MQHLYTDKKVQSNKQVILGERDLKCDVQITSKFQIL